MAKLFGIENFGLNYGMIFTAVGFVGSLGPLVAAFLAELTNSYYPAFLLGLFASATCYCLVAELNRKAGHILTAKNGGRGM